MGGHVPPAVAIEQFRPASSRRPAIVTVVVLVAVALTVWLGFRATHQDPPIPSAAPSPTVPAASGHAANQNSDSIPFVNQYDNAQGVWTIDRVTWSGPSVVLTMTITVSQGNQVLGFFAFTNADTSQAYEAQPSGRADDLVGRVVRAGQEITGTVTFAMPDAESTVFLVDSSGRQVTALLIPA